MCVCVCVCVRTCVCARAHCITGSAFECKSSLNKWEGASQVAEMLTLSANANEGKMKLLLQAGPGLFIGPFPSSLWRSARTQTHVSPAAVADTDDGMA